MLIGEINGVAVYSDMATTQVLIDDGKGNFKAFPNINSALRFLAEQNPLNP